MPKPKVYIETTVISLLTARPARDVVQTAWQQLTREWWELRRQKFDLYISNQVVTEARCGDAEAARRRLEVLQGIPELEVNDEVVALAKRLAKGMALPPRKAADAVHIATAAIHGIEFLATWNCTHLANPVLEAKARAICADYGYHCPLIATPHELMEIAP